MARAAVALLICFLLNVAVAPPPAVAQTPHPFAAGKPAEAEEPPSGIARAYKGLLVKVAAMQRDLNARIAQQIRTLQSSDSPAPLFVLLGIAFLYGVFHAVGPGHGKFIVTSYFLARDAPVSRGVLMSGFISLTQAISAIVIVAVFVTVLGQSRMQVVGHATTLELASYGIVVLLGLYMAWSSLTGRACDHGHGPASGHDHDHHHTGSGYSHGAGAGADLAGELPWYRRLGDMIPIAVAAGIRPCSGAIILLLFTMANGLYLVGVVGVLAMALGVAITVSAVGILAIGARRTAASVAGGRPAVREYVMRGMGVVGSLLVVLVGLLLFMAALERGPLL